MLDDTTDLYNIVRTSIPVCSSSWKIDKIEHPTLGRVLGRHTIKSNQVPNGRVR